MEKEEINLKRVVKFIVRSQDFPFANLNEMQELIQLLLSGEGNFAS